MIQYKAIYFHNKEYQRTVLSEARPEAPLGVVVDKTKESHIWYHGRKIIRIEFWTSDVPVDVVEDFKIEEPIEESVAEEPVEESVAEEPVEVKIEHKPFRRRWKLEE